MKAESGKREHAFWEGLSACCILNCYSCKMGKQLRPVLGPAFFIYLGYMDPGKWATAVEGGSRFGFELLWVLVLSILFATLLQALSSRLGLVTRRNLAQVCHDEYPEFMCYLLWLQCEFSIMVLELTMVLGVSIGINLLLGISFIPCILLTTVAEVLFLVALSHVGMHKTQVLTASIIGAVLLCFVLDALHANATSTVLLGMLPRLKGESLYTSLSIFGANIMPTSFYLCSMVIQAERKFQDLSARTLFSHNLIGVVLALVGTFLVNLAVSVSAGSTFFNSGLVVITLQDAEAVLGQMLSDGVAPTAVVLALICASQFSTLSGTVSAQVALDGFVGANVPVSLHLLLIKTAGILSAVFFVWNSGNEGVYQIIVFSQVILALQLPFAMAPLIKVTSSQALMDCHKNSGPVKALAWFVVALMSIMNMWLVFDMILGESDELLGTRSWNFVRDFGCSSAKWGDAMHVLVFTSTIAFAVFSNSLLIWIVSTSLKSDNKPGKTLFIKNCVPALSIPDNNEPTECIFNDDIVRELRNIENISKLDGAVQGGILTDENIMVPVQYNICKPEQEAGFLKVESPQSEHEVKQLDAKDLEEKRFSNEDYLHVNLEDSLSVTDDKTLFTKQGDQSQRATSSEDPSFVEPMLPVNLPSLSGLPLDVSLSDSMVANLTGASSASVEIPSIDDVDAKNFKETDVDMDLLYKEDYEADGWENLEQDVIPDSLISESINSMTIEEPVSGKSIGGRSDTSEGSGCGSGSLSRLSGLGRAARRQYAAILDEFWSKLFDLHGQPISHIGMMWQEVVTAIKTVQTDSCYQGMTVADSYERDNVQCSHNFLKKSWQKDNSGEQMSQIDSFFRTKSHATTSTSSWLGYPHKQGSFMGNPSHYYNLNERHYSSLKCVSNDNECNQQPATIHSYKSAYLERSGLYPPGIKGRPLHSPMQYHIPCTASAYGHSFPRGTHKVPSTMDSGNLHLEQNNYPKSDKSLSSLQSPELLGNSYTIDKMSTCQERHWNSSELSSYGAIQWGKSVVGRESMAWHPLVCRATGELDMGQSKFGMPHNVGHTQSPIGCGGNSRQAGGNVENCRVQNERAPLSFDEISPSQSHIDGFSIQHSLQDRNHSLWSRQPFEQLFGSSDMSARSLWAFDHVENDNRSTKDHQLMTCMMDWEIGLLKNFRSCITKLIQLDGSNWLFRMNSGSDEDLIALVAMRDRALLEAEDHASQRHCINSEQFWFRSFGGTFPRSDNTGSLSCHTSGVPHCGGKCVWGSKLLVSFGLWCIHRTLELSLMESRPELWGKYTYVLNRLQGVLEPAFSSPRTVPPPCLCVQGELFDSNQEGCISHPRSSLRDDGCCGLSNSLSNGLSMNSFHSYPHSWPRGLKTSSGRGKGASSSVFIEIIREVETAISARKGRTGTAAGDVAFPKGKENLVSVLKRYKRRLGNKHLVTAITGGSGTCGTRRSLAASTFY